MPNCEEEKAVPLVKCRTMVIFALFRRLDVDRQLCQFVEGNMGECLTMYSACLSDEIARKRKEEDTRDIFLFRIENFGRFDFFEDFRKRCAEFRLLQG